MDKEQKRISHILKDTREALDSLKFPTSAARRRLAIDAEQRGLMRLAIVQLEILRAKNAAADCAVRVDR